MPSPGPHDLLVRWDSFRGWYVDVGVGNVCQRYYATRSEAVEAARRELRHPEARVLIAVGINWVVAGRTQPLDPAVLQSFVTAASAGR